MTKKILLSVAASALLTTSAFAALGNSGNNNNATQNTTNPALLGDLTGIQTIIASNPDMCNRENTGTFNISQEYLKKYTFNDEINTTHTVGIGNPNTMSQFTIQIALPAFMGLSTLPANDTAMQGATIKNQAGDVVAVFSNFSTGKYVFTNIGDKEAIKTGDILHLDNGGDLQLAVTLPQGTTGDGLSGISEDDRSITWDIYTNNGTPILRDKSSWDFDYEIHPQFLVACKGKLDGLINWENDAKSFVVTKHGQDTTEAVDQAIGVTPTTEVKNGMDVYSTVLDRLTYTLDNLGGWDDRLHTTCTTTFDTWLEGNQTVMTVTGLDNTFSSGGATDFDRNSSLEALHTSGDTLGAATLVTFDPTYHIASFTTDDIDMLKGLTTFTAEFDFTDGYAANSQINPNRFEGHINLEGNETNTSLQVDPARNTDLDTMGKNIGEWQNHAFIAQIAGATQDASTQTKLFIVNRGCTPVTPTFKLIKDGKVTEVPGTEIAVNTQEKITLDSLLTKASLPEGRYAVEIVIPGVAEDFYVYAQAQGKADKSITKDLPVYNTSARD